MKTKDNELKAKRDLPELNRFCHLLLTFATTIFKPGFRYNEADHLGFMVLCFLEKQKCHMRSVLGLITNKSFRDAEVITRIMLEGSAILVWASNYPDSLPLKWRVFGWVEDFRSLSSIKNAGEPFDTKKEQEIIATLKEWGRVCFSSKTLEKEKRGEPIPNDPYSKHWYGNRNKISIRKIFEITGSSELYNKIYDETSKWVHWNPRGLGLALKRDRETTKFSAESYSAGARALAGGFYALLITLKVFDGHFKLGKTEELRRIEREYAYQLRGGNL